MFEIIKPDVNIQFIDKQRIFLAVSAIVVLLSLAAIIFIGPTYGIDFKGGSDIILQFKEEVDVEDVRKAAGAAGLPDVQVQRYGTPEQHTFLVQTRAASAMNDEKSAEIQAGLASLGDLQSFEWSESQPNRARVLFAAPVDAAAIKAVVEKADLAGVEVVKSATSGQERYDINFEGLQSYVTDAFAVQFPTQFDPQSGIARMETVGAQVGEQFRNAGILSLLAAMLAIMLYVGVRFDIRYAPGAVLALAHDLIIVLGLFTIFKMEISLTTIAALLTILGYSINDTIIIYDRIRENLDAAPEGASIEAVANKSINETLSRTVMTGVTTLAAITSIAVIGSGAIADFAVALVMGILIGTYSSVFMASAIMLRIDAYLSTRRKAQAVLDAQGLGTPSAS